MAIATSKAGKLTASIFKNKCLVGKIDDTTWWSNGFVMLKENLLPTRTLNAIKKYKSFDYSIEIASLLARMRLHKDLVLLRRQAQKVKFTNTSSGKPKLLDLYKDDNGTPTWLDSSFTMYDYLYKIKDSDEIIDSIHDISYVVMPYNIPKNEEGSVIKQTYGRDYRFIKIMEEVLEK